MALGRYASDLEPGDDLGTLEYEIQPFVIREYCHSVELHQETLQSGGDGPQHWPVPLIHIDKLRFFARHCPGGSGPNARLHFEYNAVWSDAVRVGDRVIAAGKVTERYTKRGRDYLVLEIVLTSADDGRELVRYRDTSVLSFRQATP